MKPRDPDDFADAPTQAGERGEPVDDAGDPGSAAGLDEEAARRRLAEQTTLPTPLSPDSAPPSGGNAPLAPGRLLGSYRLTALLGEGGFGQVWRVEHVDDGRVLALKVLTRVQADSAHAAERFEREGRIAASVNHPRSVYVFGAEQIDGCPVIAQELMVGGTLADQLERRSRLPASEAVERILEIIEGLEAAQQVGVLHRDIKPSNCFLDDGGAAKIGDYGLSVSLVAGSDLTQSSVFLGTPFYSSPEQVRGRPIDERADIYSVGATLYTLLTGKPPFTGTNPAEVLARIVAEPPTPFAAHGVSLPPGLDRVVMRCLRKEPDRRFKSYAALRRALLPYAPGATTTGSLVRRFFAWYVDSAIGALLNLALVPLGVTDLFFVPSVPALALQFAYLVLAEWRWGRGVGKYLFGLRVTMPNGAPPPFARVLVRTLVFYLVISGLGFAVLWLGGGEVGPVASLLLPLQVVLLVSSMRRRNGFAGIHEIVSGTRVQTMRARSAIEVPERPPRVAATPPTRIGPFTVRGEVWATEGEAFLVGRDEGLRRDVWLHTREEAVAAPDVPTSRSRRGALRVLQTGSTAGSRWEAFGAPTGASLCAWVHERGRLSWEEMRRFLLTLARELGARASRDEPTPPLTLRHLWVESDGHAKVLDFPAERECVASDRPVPVDGEGWRPLMRRVAALGLTGTVAGEEPADVPPAVPLAEHAQALLCTHLGAVERIEPHGLELFAHDLEQVSEQPATVTRRRRVGLLAALVGPYVAGAAVSVIGLWMVSMIVSPSMRATDQYLEELRTESAALADPALPASERDGLEQRREATRAVLAFYWRDAKSSSALKLPAAAVARYDSAETALADYPNVTEQEVQRAIEAFDLPAPSVASNMGDAVRAGSAALLLAALTYLNVIGALSLALAAPLRGGPLFSRLAIRLQRQDGRRASRPQCLLRAAVAWAPAFAAAAAFGLGSLTVCIAMLALAAAGAAYSLYSPERGIPDLIAGTYLVGR